MTINYLDLLLNWLKDNQSTINKIPAGITIQQRITPTNKQSQTVHIDLLENRGLTGSITVWQTGQCDMEFVSFFSTNSFWRHFEFTSVEEVAVALNGYFQDIAKSSRIHVDEEETLFNSLRIAIVNNEGDISALIGQHLQNNNYTTTTINPDLETDFVTILRLFNPNLIIIKLFPIASAKDAYVVCQEIRKDTQFCSTPIILISTNKERAQKSGATKWFDIVFQLEALHGEIQDLID